MPAPLDSSGGYAIDPEVNARVAPGWAPASVAALPVAARAEALLHLVVRGRAGASQVLSGNPESLEQELDALSGKEPAAAREGAAALACFLESWRAPRRSSIAGILNVTPDSFSDGGRHYSTDAAVDRALEMADAGADLIDIGGESTRPGAETVSPSEELRRLMPVLERLRSRCDADLSVDTRKAEVASAAIDAGAAWVNDVSGLTFDPGMVEVLSAHPQVRLVLMHSVRSPEEEVYSTSWTSETAPRYRDVVDETLEWLRRQARFAVERGVRPDRIYLDPGFGFGKTLGQNLDILRRVREYTCTGMPIYLGLSRKSSVGALAGDSPPQERLIPTAGAVAWAESSGVAVHRVHDVREMKQVIDVVRALQQGHINPWE